MFVGDAGNNVVLKFDADGTFLGTIDGSTTPQGHFVSLAGVAVDQNGTLWVADGSTNNIIEFDTRGRFVQMWTDPFGQTLGIAVDEVHAEADRLEHVLSEELEARIDAALGRPTHDPHGDPIPDANLVWPADRIE